MSNSYMPTAKISDLPSVLLIGGSSALTDTVRDATTEAGARFRTCDLVSASTSAARWRPMVIVMTEESYRFDPSGFEALAWDVGARIVRASDDEAPADEIQPLVVATMRSVMRVRLLRAH